MKAALAEQVVALIAAARHSPERRADLVALLGEQHSLYAACGLADITHVRGFVLASFEGLGLPEAAVPFVLEELQTGHDAYTIAAAARAVRGLPQPAAELEPFLRRALDNLVGRDELVSFGAFGEYLDPAGSVTAAAEVERSLAWLLQGDCCSLRELSWGRSWLGPAERRSKSRAASVWFEDQDERRASFGELFVGKPSLLAFFYTRCENPRKCSLTIAKLAAVQTRLRELGLDERVRLAAITYDPLFDSPSRLRAYAEARGLKLGKGARVLRAPEDFETLRSHFRLGVSFLRSSVSRHRIELYLLDERARVAASFTRLEWNEAEVVERLAELACAGSGSVKSPSGSAALSIAAPVLLALLPKCPLCWAAYVSLLGFAGLEHLPYPRFAAPLLFGLVLVNVLAMFLRARAHGSWWPFACALVGALLLLPLALGERLLWLTLPGLSLTFLATIAAIAGRRSWPALRAL